MTKEEWIIFLFSLWQYKIISIQRSKERIYRQNFTKIDKCQIVNKMYYWLIFFIFVLFKFELYHMLWCLYYLK